MELLVSREVLKTIELLTSRVHPTIFLPVRTKEIHLSCRNRKTYISTIDVYSIGKSLISFRSPPPCSKTFASLLRILLFAKEIRLIVVTRTIYITNLRPIVKVDIVISKQKAWFSVVA